LRGSFPLPSFFLFFFYYTQEREEEASSLFPVTKLRKGEWTFERKQRKKRERWTEFAENFCRDPRDAERN